jgi:hypothetical protein
MATRLHTCHRSCARSRSAVGVALFLAGIIGGTRSECFKKFNVRRWRRWMGWAGLGWFRRMCGRATVSTA